MPRDRRDQAWEDRADRTYTSATDHPFRFIGGVVVGLIILAIVIGILGFAGDWFGEAKRVTGPDNTRDQAITLRDDYKSLEAIAGNVCDAEAAGDKSDPNDPQIVGGSPSFQYRARYRSVKADYDRRMSNAFEAGWVRHYPFLNDLPREAPTLEEAKAAAGC